MSGEFETMENGLLALARLRHAQGQAKDVWEALAKAHEFAPASFRLDFRHVQMSNMEARVQLMEGRLAEAIGWASDVERRLTITDIPEYRSEPEYLTLIRVKIASGQLLGIPESLERLCHAMNVQGRLGGGVIEVLVLEALALQAQGRVDEAVTVLARAVSLAKLEGYVRIFVDEAEPMAQLLKHAATTGVELDYLTKLLAVYGEELQRQKPSGLPYSMTLTQREQEVLRLIAGGLSNHAAAEVLVVTEGTIKKHLNNIFGKLGVESRTQAVARARELNLI